MTKATGRTLLVVLVLASLFAVAAPVAAAQSDTVVFNVQLAGVDPEGQGFAVLRFDADAGTLCYVIVVSGIGAPTEPAPGLGNAHIHGPLPATGIAVDLETEFAQAGGSDVFHAHACVDVAPATLAAILANPSSFYVNIHTVQFPGGAIEGRLA